MTKRTLQEKKTAVRMTSQDTIKMQLIQKLKEDVDELQTIQNAGNLLHMQRKQKRIFL